MYSTTSIPTTENSRALSYEENQCLYKIAKNIETFAFNREIYTEFLTFIQALRENDSTKADKIWSTHKHFFTAIFANVNAAVFTLNHQSLINANDLRVFMNILLVKQIHPAIESLFKPDRYIIGDNEAKKAAYQNVLASKCDKAIRKLNIPAYIALFSNDEQKKIAFRRTLGYLSQSAIANLDIVEYLSLFTTDKGKKAAMNSILVSKEGIIIGKLNVGDYLALFTTDEQKKEAYENILRTKNRTIIEKLKMADYLSLFSTDDEKLTAFKNIYSSTNASARKAAEPFIVEILARDTTYKSKLESVLDNQYSKKLFQETFEPQDLDKNKRRNNQEGGKQSPSKKQKPNVTSTTMTTTTTTSTPSISLFSFLQERNWQATNSEQREKLYAVAKPTETQLQKQQAIVDSLSKTHLKKMPFPNPDL